MPSPTELLPAPGSAAAEEPPAPAQRRKRSFLGLVARLTVIGLVMAVALELAVTLMLGPQVRFPRHVVDGGHGVRVNQPGATYVHRSADVEVTFRINDRGLRADRNYTYEKPAGVKRIVCLGDSFTAGYEVEIEDCFTSVLERELTARGHTVEVLNAGVSGYSNAEACLYLERELLKYDPDVVLLSFFFNDLVDNVRSNLFAADVDDLVQISDAYVPLGGLGDRIHKSAAINFLSERSNAFAIVKEKTALAVKGWIVAANEENVENAGSCDGPVDTYQSELAAGILERIYETCRERGIAFVIQSIPLYVDAPEEGELLIDVFPHEFFDVEREGISFVATEPLLREHLGRELLYHKRSHFHWTPFANELSGKALAERILAEGIF